MYTIQPIPSRTVTHDAHDMLILCDTSFSMSAVNPATGLARIEVLRRTLTEILPTLRGAQLIRFHGEAYLANDPSIFAADGGGTEIAGALRMARGLNPCRVVLITDGQPTDDPAFSLEIARGMVAQIDAYYCGDPRDTVAIAFLRALVAANGRGGRCVVDPLGAGMLEGMHLLLTAPITALAA